MTAALSPVIASRLEKAAVDNGFDHELPRPPREAGAIDWLGFASTQCPLRIWLGTFGDAAPLAQGARQGVLLAAFSQQNVARPLGVYGTPMAAPLPRGALGGRIVTDYPALHRLLRRAFQLSKTLPDELLHRFEQQTAALPQTTEAERLVVQRVGQDLFRQGLLA
jgi:putative restriction endonuclease